MKNHQNSMIFQTQISSFGQVGDVLKALKLSGVTTIKAAIGCQNEEFITYIKNGIETCLKIRAKQYNPFVLLGKKEADIEVSKKRKYKHAIDLSSNSIATIFINEYRQKLKALNDQYDLSMIRERSIIKIFSKVPISTVFESQIIDMKRKLKWLIIPNQKLYKKMKFSRYIRQKLQIAKIRVLFLSVNKCVLLHSSEVSMDEMNTVASIFQYEAFILHFQNMNFSKIVNKLYFQMLAWHSQPLLARVEEDYEIKCEINKSMLGIIMHTRDPIFEKEPKQQLIKLLQNLLYISFYSSKPLQQKSYLKKQKLLSNSFSYRISSTFVYTSWNKLKKITPEEVRCIYRKFLQGVNQNTWLRIGFNTGGLFVGNMERIQQLAGKYNLVFEQFGETGEANNIVHIKFKSFNTMKKKQKAAQISLFLQQAISGNFSNQTDVTFEPHQSLQNNNNNKKDSESQQQLQEESASQIDNQLEMEIPIVAQKLEQFLQFQFEKPQVAPSTKTNIKKGKRNKKLEQLIEEKYRVTCKIWNAIVETEYYIPKKYGATVCQIRPVLQFELQPQMTVKKPNFLAFSALQNDQPYYLVSQLSSPEQFVLTHLMIVYNAL